VDGARGKEEAGTTRFSNALFIQRGERDHELGLQHREWPREWRSRKNWPSWRWEPGEQHLRRRIVDQDADGKEAGYLAGDLEEKILRFPSAPIHGLHRIHEYHVNEGKSESMHTYRVLCRPGASKFRRVFIFHNGLNETEKVGLYYQLASHLIAEDQKLSRKERLEKGETVCILRPLPGHLARSRFYGFAETPLDHYLWDGSHLFRQFLRFMIETQWLLSALVRRSRYRCISGLNLLAEAENPEKSRLDDETLAQELKAQWKHLHDASREQIKQRHVGDGQPPRLNTTTPFFLSAVRSLREALGLEDKLSGDLEDGEDEMAVHVIGYSLGGFAAQSVFMSWPFLISSCSTLLSGGPLRALAPTAFADPEEWQTVLHSLRYEVDEAMMNGFYRPADSARPSADSAGEQRVAGIELDLFLYLKRTFYEVFQQEYRGSFQTRLVAFRQRMLFVVGGNDPIVRPESVLDSGPPDGVNMLAVGGLGHFLGDRAQDDEEDAQRSFWIPEVGRVISNLADTAAYNQHRERAENWLNEDMKLPSLDDRRKRRGDVAPQQSEQPRSLEIGERLAIQSDGKLPGSLFERCLEDLLARVDARRGILFVLRNEVPTVLLDEEARRRHAAILHHDDARIVRYIDGLCQRRKLIEDNLERVSVILPWNAKTITETIDAPPGHPSQAEGGGGQMPARLTPSEIWEGFVGEWGPSFETNPDALRIYDGREGLERGGLPYVDPTALKKAAAKRLRFPQNYKRLKTSLPDCWIWMSPKFLLHDDEEPLDTATAREELCKIVPERYLPDASGLITPLRKEHLRVVAVSRARYNPRYRGRLIAEPEAAKKILHHATMCILGSVPFEAYDLDERKFVAPEPDTQAPVEAATSSA
jgi:pimeloyl-ACP methyl ester carboxylesterase